jgi:hypothetical protein
MMAPVLSPDDDELVDGVGVGVGSPVLPPPPPVDEADPVDEGVPDGV